MKKYTNILVVRIINGQFEFTEEELNPTTGVVEVVNYDSMSVPAMHNLIQNDALLRYLQRNFPKCEPHNIISDIQDALYSTVQ